MLGLTRGANSDAVNRAYKRMITEARGNDAEKAKIENAHSSIMMFQLSARMKACTPLSPWTESQPLSQ